MTLIDDGYLDSPEPPRRSPFRGCLAEWRLTNWLQAHRVLARLIVRGPIRRWVSRRVWAEALSRPSFKAALDAGLADLAAGRTYRYDLETGETIPNPSWPKDGPQPR